MRQLLWSGGSVELLATTPSPAAAGVRVTPLSKMCHYSLSAGLTFCAAWVLFVLKNTNGVGQLLPGLAQR